MHRVSLLLHHKRTVGSFGIWICVVQAGRKRLNFQRMKSILQKEAKGYSYSAAHLTSSRGTLAFRSAPVAEHWANVSSVRK